MLICTLTFSGWAWGILYGWGLRGCGLLLHGAAVHGLGFFSGLHISEGTCGHESQGNHEVLLDKATLIS